MSIIDDQTIAGFVGIIVCILVTAIRYNLPLSIEIGKFSLLTVLQIQISDQF